MRCRSAGVARTWSTWSGRTADQGRPCSGGHRRAGTSTVRGPWSRTRASPGMAAPADDPVPPSVVCDPRRGVVRADGEGTQPAHPDQVWGTPLSPVSRGQPRGKQAVTRPLPRPELSSRAPRVARIRATPGCSGRPGLLGHPREGALPPSGHPLRHCGPRPAAPVPAGSGPCVTLSTIGSSGTPNRLAVPPDPGRSWGPIEIGPVTDVCHGAAAWLRVPSVPPPWNVGTGRTVRGRYDHQHGLPGRRFQHSPQPPAHASAAGINGKRGLLQGR
jgi:hypothetical protein